MRNEPPVKAGCRPRRGDHKQTADEEEQRAPEQAPDAELGRERFVGIRAAPGPRYARIRQGRRSWRIRQQTGNIASFLPVGHALAPDQRVLGDSPVADQVSEYSLGVGAFRLPPGCNEPGSPRHFVSTTTGARMSRGPVRG